MFTEAFLPVQNGVSVSVATLAGELRARRNRVVVVAPHYPELEEDAPFTLRVPSAITAFNPGYPVSYPFYPILRREIRRLEMDVIHSHNPFFLGLLASKVARDTGVPLIATYHTLLNHYSHYVSFLPDGASQRLLKWWLPEYYNRCDRVIAPSQIAKQSLWDYGVDRDIEVLPTAVPTPHPEQVDRSAQLAARERLGVPPNAKMLMYSGRIALEKNLELLLSVFGRLAEDHPDLYLVIIGSGPHEETLHALAAEIPHADRIIIPGSVQREDLDPVYAAADIFVFPSCSETQGLVVAEARAAGTPCVVVNQGGAAETVVYGEDGFVVNAEVDAFANAVSVLLTRDELRKEMSENCRQRAMLYTPAAMTDRMLVIYEEAVAAYRPGRTAELAR
jgi:glycosyltransferase involved in cell wall biosynthesis